MLSELRSYSRDVPDAKSTVCTLEYLQACNHLFEKGFLSSKQVSSTNREVICSIEKGFGFFKKWLEGIHQKCKCVLCSKHNNVIERWCAFVRSTVQQHFSETKEIFIMAKYVLCTPLYTHIFGKHAAHTGLLFILDKI